MELIVDTTVLIDIWRFRSKRNRIADLVAKAGSNSLVVPWIVQAEFQRGAMHRGIPTAELAEFLSGFLFAPMQRDTIDAYCTLWVAAAKKGKAPDYPDLWIAAHAVSRPAPLLTRNPNHFTGIPNLKAIPYTLSQK
jgi:predicted nucleic acid-binding protein